MSHGTHADHAQLIEAIRGAREGARPADDDPRRPAGPQAAGRQVRRRRRGRAREGADLRLRPRQRARRRRTGSSFRTARFSQAVEPGTRLLRRRRQAGLPGDERDARPDRDRWSRSAARISNNKGLNVPDVVLPLAALTEKDRADLAFALDQHVDWIALSFVQRPEDVAEARRLIGGKAALLAKIEKPAGDRAARRNPGAGRRGDGRARRPRRRDAARGRCRRCRRGSSRRRGGWAGRWWSRPRCSNR